MEINFDRKKLMDDEILYIYIYINNLKNDPK
jgi:hypothetical protein